MAIVRLGPNGEVEVIDPGTPEEHAEAEAAVLKLAALLGTIDAQEDWRRQQAEHRAKREAAISSSDESTSNEL